MLFKRAYVRANTPVCAQVSILRCRGFIHARRSVRIWSHQTNEIHGKQRTSSKTRVYYSRFPCPRSPMVYHTRMWHTDVHLDWTPPPSVCIMHVYLRCRLYENSDRSGTNFVRLRLATRVPYNLTEHYCAPSSPSTTATASNPSNFIGSGPLQWSSIIIHIDRGNFWPQTVPRVSRGTESFSNFRCPVNGSCSLFRSFFLIVSSTIRNRQYALYEE